VDSSQGLPASTFSIKGDEPQRKFVYDCQCGGRLEEAQMAVAQILKLKGRSVITASADDTVQAVSQVLAEKRIGAVVIVDGRGGIAGIVSERDVVRMLARHGAKALDMAVRDVMTQKVRTCTPADSEAELMSLMTVNRIRHLPVLENGKLAGMISIGDVVKFRMEAIEHEAEEMKIYIAQAG
jgi:CBS domain-containing protein